MAAACRMPVSCSVAFVYPRLFALHTLTDDVGDIISDAALPKLPNPLPLMLEKLEPEGANKLVLKVPS
jgi:hypothetical protein